MKKIILGLVLLMLSSLVFAGDFNSTSGEMTVRLFEGWNLIPTMTVAYDQENCYSAAPWAYYYSGVLKQYVGMSINPQGNYFPNRDVFQQVNNTEYKFPDSANNPYYGIPQLGSMWVYSNKNCIFITELSKPADIQSQITDFAKMLSNAELANGWNFINYHSWMLGKTPKDIFANCDVTRVATWYADKQSWKFYESDPSPQEMATALKQSNIPITNIEIGTPILVKVSGSCHLNYGTANTGPPALPN